MNGPLQPPIRGSDLISLPPREAEDLLYAIDGSLKVQRRFQFFLWSQGGLQGPLPHETLICAWGEIENARYKYEIFSRAVLDERLTRQLADPANSLLARLIEEWLRRDRRPCLYNAVNSTNGIAVDCGGDCPPHLVAEFRRHGFQRVVAHGSHFKDGSSSFFIFVNGPPDSSARDAYLVEMLIPHLHSTLHRVAEIDDDERYVDEIDSDQLLSDREVQVLGWVRDGKTNREIAQILDISPLTVKNHVQKILRKLQVTNRTQAVGKAVASRLLSQRDSC